MKRIASVIGRSVAVGSVVVALGSCTGDSAGVPTESLVSVVVWVKGDPATGGAIWGKVLAGDLATSRTAELFPGSTKKRQTPHLTGIEKVTGEVALYWVEQQPGSSHIHRYSVADAGTGFDEIWVGDMAYASFPASESPIQCWFTSNVSGDSEIYLKQGLGVPKQMTTTPGADAYPDALGDRVVYASNFEIFTMSALNGADKVNISNDPSHDIQPRFSRDGTKVVFVSDRGGKYNVYMMNPDGTGVERLTNHSADDSSPSFSADMRYVVYASKADGDWDIYALELATKTVTNLTNDSVDDVSPHCGKFKEPGT